MKKLSNRQLQKIQQQMTKKPDRGRTWVGYRPVVIDDTSKYSRKDRYINKRRCRETEKEN